MRIKPKKNETTFGEFISTVYGLFGRRRGTAIVMHAVNTHQLQFRGKRSFLIC
ncbi:MAG: hypothetical protein AB9869_15770 [Verrucomicrobiia bacterium]